MKLYSYRETCLSTFWTQMHENKSFARPSRPSSFFFISVHFFPILGKSATYHFTSSIGREGQRIVQKIKNARAKRAKLHYFILNYANLRPSRSSSCLLKLHVYLLGTVLRYCKGSEFRYRHYILIPHRTLKIFLHPCRF